MTSNIPRFDSKIYESKVVGISKKIELAVKDNNCKRFYLSRPSDNSRGEFFVNNQVLAMWAAIKNDMPTSNGYSGNKPKGWSGEMSRLELKEWLKEKGISDYEARNVCWIKND